MTPAAYASQFSRQGATLCDAPWPVAPNTQESAKSNLVYLHGSLGWAIAHFLASTEVASRAEGTKIADRRVLDVLCERYGGGLLNELLPADVKKIRNAIRQDFATSTADRAISLISVVWDWADENRDLELGPNPKRGLKKVDCARP